MIFSEEMKYAIKYGYKIDIDFGYRFERGKDLFKKYVETHYEIKINAEDLTIKNLSKLFLNALYGKFGMREIESRLKNMDVKEANKTAKNYNYSIFAHLNDNKVLIKYSSRVNENLRLLFKNQEEKNTKMNETGLGKNRGVLSSVQIASAISAYARISINEFKNIPGNPCIMSDTDSVVLPKRLDNKHVGRELGQMKLEHVITEGIFIRKKNTPLELLL